MIKMKWRVPYRRWVEGVLADSIVVYGERPYSVYSNYHETEKLIQIDLWLFILRINWVSRQPTPTKPTEGE